MTDKLTQARRRYEAASDALNALLEQGASPDETTKARDVLGAAERELAKAEGNEQERLRKLEDEQRKEAEVLVDELSAEIGARMSAIIKAIQIPEPPRIASQLAQTIHRARSEAASAAEALSQARDRLDHLEARHGELSQQWDTISNRRAQGDTKETDTNELVVIAADRGGIEALIEKLQDEIQNLDLHHARAAEALRLAERRWAGQTAETWRQGMLAVCEPLEHAITAAADEIGAHRGWNDERRRAYAPIALAFRRHLESAGFSSGRKVA